MGVPRIFSGTGTGTFSRDQIFPVPVPVLFSGTKFFRYRDRYFFPGPIFSDTGTGTFFRDQFFPVPVPVPSKKRENSRDWDKTGTIWDFLRAKILAQYLQYLIPFR